jgi:putative glutamine amidotransferase
MDHPASSQRPTRHGEGVNTPALIGVSPCLDPGRVLRTGADYWYLNRSYTRSLAAAGVAPLVLCPDTPAPLCAEVCEGLVLSGGGDLPGGFADGDFANGGWRTRVNAPETDERIAWERALLDAFAIRGKPVLGVCFGMQLMNLHFGGSLLTSLAQSGGSLDHGGGGRTTSHELSVARSSPFFADLELPTRVNSSHRQGIENVAPGFVASAWASDGLVEAIEQGELIGVEWHPESDASGPAIYERFAARVLRRRA